MGIRAQNPSPNMTEIKAMDSYFAWRREQEKSKN